MSKGGAKGKAKAAAAESAKEERLRKIEVGFLEGVHRRLPGHGAVVESLGCLYTEMGRYEDGLRADREMVQLDPSSAIAWYNLGCSLALTRRPDDAFDALQRAVKLGYADAEWMLQDDDLAPIRADPRFAQLLAEMLSGAS
jgi:tetratricopeptide (TPR) repeat protein